MPDVKRLAIAGGVVVLLLLLFWRAAASVSQPSPSRPHPGLSLSDAGTPVWAPSIGPSPIEGAGTTTPSEGGTRDYAVALPELAGLPEDAQPGTPMELWVAWEPPVTKHPRIQRLATGVTLARIIPPVTPDGAPAALLRIPKAQIPSVLYGDRYGVMSAVLTGE
jgi:hypothetical protein